MSETNQPVCPECGKLLPEGSTHGLCPACLMSQAMASGTLDTQPDGKRQAPLPSVEEMAGKFPQFEVAECLGRGGMGVVYKAWQKSLDRWVAIKVLAPEREREERFAEHFEREAKTLAKMSHPNIVTVFDHGEADGLFYFVMEFVDGVNLRDLLREGKLEPEQALAIVPPVCDALEYAHNKGVVHRDIKPENLLLDREGRVKIADFGIASLVGASGEKSGTPPYMAPEQRKGAVDRRADIYALGVVLYEMLTGERPGTKLEPPSRKVSIDVRLDEVVLRALEEKPELRYQQASVLKTQVETIASQAGGGSGASVPPVMRRAPACPSDNIGFSPDSVRRHFVILAVTWWISCPLSIIETFLPTKAQLVLAIFWVPVSLVSLVFWCILLHRQWSLLQGHGARITPGKAVGFGFIPFYCFYWWFVAYAGLATDTNRYLKRMGIRSTRMSYGLAVSFCILGVLACTLGLLAVPGVVLMIPYTIIGFVLVVQQRDCVLAILGERSRMRPPAAAGSDDDRIAKQSSGFRMQSDTQGKTDAEPHPRLLGIWWIPVGVATGLSVIWGMHADLQTQQAGWFLARMLIVPFTVFLAFLAIARIGKQTEGRPKNSFGKVILGVIGVVLVLFAVENLVFPPLKRALWTAQVGTPKIAATLPRVSRIQEAGKPAQSYLDFDEARSVAGVELPSQIDDRTRTLTESGADLMVDLPQKMTSWAFVTPVDKPIRLAKVSVDTWKNPSRLFHKTGASMTVVTGSSSTPAPREADVIQVRGGVVSCRVMPSQQVENNEVIADVIEIPQRRPPADPDSNVFLFETAEGTQGLLRVAGVTFDGSDNRDGLQLEFIIFTDRFVSQMVRGTPKRRVAWVDDADLKQPTLFTDQGGYMPGARGVDEFVTIDKSGLRLTPADIKEIAGTTDLKYLVLTDSSISDDDLAAFHGLQSLITVELNATLANTAQKPRITDAGLEHVARWKTLRQLQLHGLPITDDGLRHLVHLSELRSLQLGGTQVRGSGLTALRNLNWLRMDATPVQDEDLRHIACLENLEQLYLDSTAISDKGLEHLAGMKRLRILNLHNTRVTAQGIADLEARMPGIAIGWDKPTEPAARADGVRGPYELKLSDDYTFEIRAICRNPRKDPQWFHPDGRLFEQPPYEILALYEPLANGSRWRVKPEDEIFVVYGDQHPDGGEAVSFRLQWAPGEGDVVTGFYDGDFPTVRDPGTGKPYQLVDQFGLQKPVDRIDLDVRVVTANARWEPVATYQNRVNTTLLEGASVMFGDPKYDSNAKRHEMSVIHDVDRDAYALRVIADMKDGSRNKVQFHAGPRRGPTGDGFALIHDHDLDIKQVNGWVLERTPLLKGRINGIALHPNPSEQTKDNADEQGNISGEVVAAAPLTAPLATGSVELVAISRYPTTNQPWWRLDGMPSGTNLFLTEASVFLGKTGAVAADDEFLWYSIVARLHNLPDDASKPTWNLEPRNSWAEGRATASDEDRAGQLVMIATQQPRGASTMNVSIGIASAPWETIARAEAHRIPPQPYPSDYGDVLLLQPSAVDGGIRLTATHTFDGMEMRLIAVEDDGRHHLGEDVEQAISDGLGHTAVTFPGLSLSQRNVEFQFQVRPYEWVEFKNVSLSPQPGP